MTKSLWSLMMIVLEMLLAWTLHGYPDNFRREELSNKITLSLQPAKFKPIHCATCGAADKTAATRRWSFMWHNDGGMINIKKEMFITHGIFFLSHDIPLIKITSKPSKIILEVSCSCIWFRLFATVYVFIPEPKHFERTRHNKICHCKWFLSIYQHLNFGYYPLPLGTTLFHLSLFKTVQQLLFPVIFLTFNKRCNITKFPVTFDIAINKSFDICSELENVIYGFH